MPTNYHIFDNHGHSAIVESLDDTHAIIKLHDGRMVSVPRSSISTRVDGNFQVDFSLSEAFDIGKIVIPVVAEQLDIEKREVSRTIRLTKSVYTEDVAVEEALRHEHVDIEHVPVNQYVDTTPAVRQEGATTIIPLVEEVLVVEKRLLLREEIRITRREEVVTNQEVYTLRRENVRVERDGEDTDTQFAAIETEET